MSVGPEEFFNSAQDLFLTEVQNRGVERRAYNVAGLPCATEIVGAGLSARLSRALAHLDSPAEPVARLTIRAWDGPMIPAPWSESEYGPRGLIRGFNTNRFLTAFDHATESLSMLDRDRGLAIFWTRSAESLPTYESGAPFRTIFGWWMETQNRILVHAGAVAKEKGAVLLVGPGGSGKSTTALLCLLDGWKYLADDYCVIKTGDSPRVFTLYSAAKAAGTWLDTSPEFTRLREASSETHEDKQLLFLHEICPAQLAQSAICRVCLLPTVSSEIDTAILPATTAEALRAIAPSTIFQSALSGTLTLPSLSDFVQRLPVFRLKLGSALDQISTRVDDCLNGV